MKLRLRPLSGIIISNERRCAMKKRSIIIAVTLLLMVSLAAYAAIIVYVNNSGTRYHRAVCKYVAKNRTAITLAEAKNKGYTPCTYCKPPIR
jgi:hypothetical protein